MLIKEFAYSFPTVSLIFWFSLSIMSFFKFITHPKRSTDLFNTIQTTQILYPQRRKKSYETNPAQEKQHKEFILTDSKNIFT